MKIIKFKTSSLIGTLMFSSILLSSSSVDEKDLKTGIWIDSGWREALSWQPISETFEQKSKTVFRSHGYELKFSRGHESYYLNNNYKNLVMVSASRHTVLGRSIHQHPNVVGVFPTDSFYDFVLVDLRSPEDRDALAQASHEDIGACGAMIPVNLDQNLVSLGDAQSPTWSTLLKLDSAKTLADSVSGTNIQATVTTLEALGSRYHAGANAALATNTVKDLWQALLPNNATLTEFSNASSSTVQNNLILTIPGTVDDSTAIVIGAHLDSINRSDETNAPGADDDASGIATLTEMIRVIKTSDATFARRVEFHAYGAEEVGLIGSSLIARSYAAAGRSIAGMLQIDMNGYPQPENAEKIFLVSTDTSSPLRRGLKDILDLYLGGNYEELTLSAGTSDHKSWTNAGYHAVFPFEHPQNYNKALHSSADKSTLLNFSYAARFGKLATLWVAHMAGLTTASSESEKSLSALVATSNDIKIAESPGEKSGSRFAVAASTNTANVVSCVVTSATATGCARDPAEYSLVRSSTTKNFYAGKTDLVLSDAEFHRFIAYDSSGIAIAQRTIQLKKK